MDSDLNHQWIIQCDKEDYCFVLDSLVKKEHTDCLVQVVEVVMVEERVAIDAAGYMLLSSLVDMVERTYFQIHFPLQNHSYMAFHHVCGDVVAVEGTAVDPHYCIDWQEEEWMCLSSTPGDGVSLQKLQMGP